MNTCQKFKTIENYKCEDCLLQVTYTQHRITLTKLRLSNHKLALETDRYLRPYKKKPESKKECVQICKLDMEDEYH